MLRERLLLLLQEPQLLSTPLPVVVGVLLQPFRETSSFLLRLQQEHYLEIKVFVLDQRQTLYLALPVELGHQPVRQLLQLMQLLESLPESPAELPTLITPSQAPEVVRQQLYQDR
jgi:hypothetical protein